MAKVKSYAFTVEGRGVFPFDMLRYDACFPATSVDVDRISICHHDREDLGNRKVRLCKKGDIGPTLERWRSFGWVVLESDPIR